MHFSVVVVSAAFIARALAVGVVGSPEGFVSISLIRAFKPLLPRCRMFSSQR